MATKKKKTSRKKSTSRKVKRINTQNNILSNEMFCIATIAVSALALLSLFARDSMGAAGEYMRQVLLGLFGSGGYILPIFLLIFSVYMLFNKTTIVKPSKSYGAVILFFSAITLTHIITLDPTVKYADFIDYILVNYKRGSVTNGGFFGALFGNVIYKVLGKPGSLILLLAASLICLMLVTGRSVFETIAGFAAWIRSSFTYEDDEYENYEEEEPEFEPVIKPELPSKRLPEKHGANKGKPKLYVIDEDEKDKDKEKILLIREELKLKGKQPDFMKRVKLEKVRPRESDPEAKATRPYPVMESEEEPEIEEGEIFINTAPAIPIEIVADRHEAPSPKSDFSPRSDFSIEVPRASSIDKEYAFPPIDLLNINTNQGFANSRAQILENSRKLESTLKSFGVEAKVVEVSMGPAITRYELSPGSGVKVSRISGLADDLALNLAAQGIRIEAPIPGKSVVGIEVPNKEVQPVYLREVIQEDTFQKFPSKLAFALGKDIAGNPVVTDIAKMPHLLIAGATGSGKSVCINTLITSIIYKARPDEVKLLMVDPKVVELSVYNGIPHLLIPVVTDPKKAAGALNWAVREMINRYNLFAETSVRDLKGYNAYKAENGESDFLPQIVIIIDELSDLMMAAPGEVEDAICRLAQMARAAGLHLIIATQRPSVDVITGLIKANVPSRLAFAVSSGTDSRTILDMVGAEKLLGKGDMLFNPVGMGKPVRIQGAFISDKEVEHIVSFLKQGTEQEYDQEMIDNITSSSGVNGAADDDDLDEFYEQAVEFVILKEKASASMLQRQFRIGYNRASRLIEDLETRGVVGPEDGSKPRKVLITYSQWKTIKDANNAGMSTNV